ncbi:hypothetical protein HNP89_000922 [Methanococcus maripaludis]|uniref:Uncharacterized protein n=1 Tax=Methanococcus maripaludis TaxID=39152 RepID=A0A7J9P0G5_METMI|nr:hypothetical protein [Methanococcus maripaludis]MBA2852965.1 hypothetical protein [Methanococcus maripaludis]
MAKDKKEDTGPKELSSKVIFIIKLIGCGAGFAGIMWYIMNNSVMGSDVVRGLAAVPFVFYLLVELLDTIVDMNKVVYTPLFKNYSGYVAIVLTVLTVVSLFFVTLWALSGSITLSIGSMGASSVVVAAIFALYLLAPNTGKEKLLLYMFIGATIATKFAYMSIIPIFSGFGL